MNAVQDALERGQALIDGARSIADLRAVEPEAFGKRSALAGITATLRDLAPSERRDLGRAVQMARASPGGTVRATQPRVRGGRSPAKG